MSVEDGEPGHKDDCAAFEIFGSGTHNTNYLYNC